MAFILKYNTPGLIKMKSVERVVSPIATHLYYLILICESGESSESFTGLEGAAKEVVDATETMAAVASRFLEGLDDDTMRSEMEPAMSALLASGKHVLLAAQKLSIQPSQAEHKEEFVMSTQNVFLGVVKGIRKLADLSVAPSLTYTSLFLKRETDKWDGQNNHIVQVTKDMAEKIYHMVQFLKRRGPIQSKEAFIYTAREMISGCQSITQFVRVIAEHCLDKRCKDDLLYITEQILTITNQLTIISSVNAATASCKSSNEILVKNAQSLLHVILRGIRAAETACIKGLKQPDPDSDGAEAAVLCLQWRRNLLTHRAQQNSCLETDELGLRKTSQYLPGPSLAAHPLHEGSL
ncbi:uncharacterized protein LOC125739076 isoform X4 [Brienomyrus brachyistius]|uniref:uncharacterized protein LOC125739076 isoform X4 n=1 Tax=Brienomyrus brachyistius TaxID=42636 RepID=UPI0020B233CF|nr:uncharacterized protein LOC125739076 isoform X4 [Brienomyrus brachyistius]